MLRSHLILAVRNLLRRRLHSLLNVLGLGLALTFLLLALRYAQYEQSWDGFHPDADRIHLLRFTGHRSAGTRWWTNSPAALAPAIATHVPGIEEVVRIQPAVFLSNPGWLRHGEQALQRVGVYADARFTKVFSFSVVAGDVTSALTRPDGLILTRTTAAALLGPIDPIGATVSVDTGHRQADFTVVAVIEVPENSSLQVDFLLPMAATTPAMDWGSWNCYTFVKLAPGTDPRALASQVDAFLAQHFSQTAVPPDDRIDTPAELLSLRDLHFAYDSAFPFSQAIQLARLSLIVLLAGAVLLLACVNFTNLATATAATRLREVGVRKTMGAGRVQLAAQFLGESILLSSLAVLVAVALAEVVLPWFNGLTGRQMTLLWLDNGPWLVGIAVVVGLVAGAYPAILLSRSRAAVVLRGALPITGVGWVGRALLVLQFAVATAFIGTTWIVSRQVQYLRTKNLGFEPKALVAINTDPDVQVLARLYRRLQEDVQAGRLAGVTTTNMLFGNPSIVIGTDPMYQGKGLELPDGRHLGGNYFVVGPDFVATLGLRLVAGRDFHGGLSEDLGGSVLVNESFVRLLGLGDVVGDSPSLPAAQRLLRGKRIVGVVRDFHLRPLQDEIQLAAIHLRLPEEELIPGQQREGQMHYLVIRLAPGQAAAGFQLLRRRWEELVPDRPYTGVSLDQSLDRSLRQESRTLAVAAAATGLAILVACLGVFGLSALAAERRTREIGIRKALGASATSILSLLSRELAWLMLAAAVLAWPTAFMAARHWLQQYPYRVPLEPLVFVAGSGVALVVAWLAAAWHSLRAALANPVETLRYE